LLLAEHRLVNGSSRWFHLRASASVVDLHRFGADGFHLRTGLGVEMTQRLRYGFSFGVRAVPFLQLSQYRLRADGSAQPRYGISEQLSFRYRADFFHAEIRLNLEQRLAGHWQNDYATLEQVYFDLSPNISLGVAHEIASSLLDESTGRLNNVRVFDGRDSRLTVFAEWKI